MSDDSEDLVETICHRLFFRDFVVRSPRFRMPGGEQREAADLLVPFRDQLISVQVKGRDVVPVPQNLDREIARLEKRIRAGITQIKTIKRAIDTKQLESVETARGFRIPFDCDRQWRHTGVVILDTPVEKCRSPEEQIRLFAYVTRVRGIPTHVFHRADLELIAQELSTLPDFLEYLDVRARLLEAEVVAPQTFERDLLALHKMGHEALDKALRGELSLLVVEEGIWETYRTQHAEAIARRDSRDKVSLLVDEVIENLYRAVGFDIRSEDPLAEDMSDRFAEASAPGYLGVIAELASLNRVRRRALGELMLEKARKAIGRPYSCGFFLDPASGVGFAVVSTSARRGERRTLLENVAFGAACSNAVPRVIGIATEPADHPTHSYDAVVANLSTLTPEGVEEFRELGKNLFGPQRKVTTFEFE